MGHGSGADAAPLLELGNVEVVYGRVIQVLRGVSLAVPQGAIVALLGANGAGKTTTLKAISGLLKTEDGEVTAQVESAVGSYDPFGSDEFDKKDYRLLLDDAIDRLPELQRRIVVMWRQDIPIESNDPSVESISKVLGKSEKTIRTHRDKAFASLKRCLERKGKVR